MIECEDYIKLLESSDPVVVSEAAFSLADMGCSDAAPHLLRILFREEFATINAVAYALGELKVQGAKSKLISLVGDPRTKGHRGSFLYALLSLDCRDDYPEIVKFLFDDYFEVRQKAAMILEQIIPHQADVLLAMSREGLQESLGAMPSDDERFDQVKNVYDDVRSEIARRAQASME